MQSVVDYGTGIAARQTFPVYGKTGTTDNFTDAWFTGCTRTLCITVWMGYNKPHELKDCGRRAGVRRNRAGQDVRADLHRLPRHPEPLRRHRDAVADLCPAAGHADPEDIEICKAAEVVAVSEVASVIEFAGRVEAAEEPLTSARAHRQASTSASGGCLQM